MADGAGWRAKANFKEKNAWRILRSTHRPPLRAVGAFSPRFLAVLKPVRLFETPIPAKASCLGAAIFKPGHHISL